MTQVTEDTLVSRMTNHVLLRDPEGLEGWVTKARALLIEASMQLTLTGGPRPPEATTACIGEGCADPSCPDWQVNPRPERVWLSPVKDSSILIAHTEDDGRSLPVYVPEPRPTHPTVEAPKMLTCRTCGGSGTLIGPVVGEGEQASVSGFPCGPCGGKGSFPDPCPTNPTRVLADPTVTTEDIAKAIAEVEEEQGVPKQEFPLGYFDNFDDEIKGSGAEEVALKLKSEIDALVRSHEYWKTECTKLAEKETEREACSDYPSRSRVVGGEHRIVGPRCAECGANVSTRHGTRIVCNGCGDETEIPQRAETPGPEAGMNTKERGSR